MKILRSILPLAVLAITVPQTLANNFAGLISAIDKQVARAEAKDAIYGICIYSLTDQKIIYEKNANRLFSAASNTKLVVTASALSLLGEDYRLQTKFLLDGEQNQAVFHGNLWVIGGGDPCLSSRFYQANEFPPFVNVIQILRAQGIRTIQGAIILDDRFFDQEFVAPEWPRNQLSLDYCAPISALSVLESRVEVTVNPTRPSQLAAIQLLPVENDFVLQNQVLTKTGKGNPTIALAIDAENQLTAKGSIFQDSGSYTGSVSVPEPTLYFGAVLLQTLEKSGIKVVQGYRRVANGDPLEEAKLIYLHESKLWNALYATNKESENFYAEHLFKLLGALFAKQGSWQGGSQVVQNFLMQSGFLANEFVVKDGSGLSRSNQFTPFFFVKLLKKMYQGNLRELYLKTLPRCGIDGTLETRLAEANYRGKVRAKTGWIQGASSLSGYVQANDGGVYIFSMLIEYHSHTSNRFFKEIMDNICKLLIDWEGPSR